MIIPQNTLKVGDVIRLDSVGMTITEFLLQRIAEDEAVAHKALANWGDVRRLNPDDPDGPSLQVVQYLPHYDPARVLAECEAKRRIVEGYLLRLEQSEHPRGEVFGHHATGMGVAIRLLASVYADHAEYRQEWKP